MIIYKYTLCIYSIPIFTLYSTCPNCGITVASSLVPTILFMTSLRSRSVQLTSNILRSDSIVFLSFFLSSTHVSLSYDSIYRAICAATLTSCIKNIAKAPFIFFYRQQYSILSTSSP